MPKRRITRFTKPILYDGQLEYGSNTECAADPEAWGKYTVRDWLATVGKQAILAGGIVVRLGADMQRLMALLQHIELMRGIMTGAIVLQALAARPSKR
jgi:hypothetical protein